MTSYLARCPQEQDHLSFAMRLLGDGGVDLLRDQDHRMRVTVGAVLADRYRRILHVTHPASSGWVLPTGPPAAEDGTLHDAALRVLTERGVSSADVLLDGTHPTYITALPAGAGATENGSIEFLYFFWAASDVVAKSKGLERLWRHATTLSEGNLRDHIISRLK
ncbi:hypothetical protein [Streptomyces hygroscopicus]|uniref:hypothetical protein n=1 Tax=Streptomyces hygroscopicus TaxID=1912 RepID=UPI0007DAF8F2|nr:hypothetical protein [Streptomyces sp. NBRC 109436]